MSKSTKLLCFLEWLAVAFTAVTMSRIGYWFLSRVTDRDWSDWKDTKWVFYSCGVSVVTWSFLWVNSYRFTSRRSLLLWIVLGALSPLLGCFVFFPATPFALAELAEHFQYFIPFGIVTGVAMFVAVMGVFKMTTLCATALRRP